jgi:hypothetical protein
MTSLLKRNNQYGLQWMSRRCIVLLKILFVESVVVVVIIVVVDVPVTV